MRCGSNGPVRMVLRQEQLPESTSFCIGRDATTHSLGNDDERLDWSMQAERVIHAVSVRGMWPPLLCSAPLFSLLNERKPMLL